MSDRDYPAPFLDGVDLQAYEFPCKCGETHRGPYALYDYGRCNCPHEYGFMHERHDADGYEHCPVCWLTRKKTNPA